MYPDFPVLLSVCHFSYDSKSLTQFILFIDEILALPFDTSLYRLVLVHGNFGVHDMSIPFDANDRPPMKSVYDLETGCIVPAILFDPLMKVVWKID